MERSCSCSARAMNSSAAATDLSSSSYCLASGAYRSFKQVAADRSHAERRVFDLKLATGQIAASVRPGLPKSRVTLALEIPSDITLDSYPTVRS